MWVGLSSNITHARPTVTHPLLQELKCKLWKQVLYDNAIGYNFEYTHIVDISDISGNFRDLSMFREFPQLHVSTCRADSSRQEFQQRVDFDSVDVKPRSIWQMQCFPNTNRPIWTYKQYIKYLENVGYWYRTYSLISSRLVFWFMSQSNFLVGRRCGLLKRFVRRGFGRSARFHYALVGSLACTVIVSTGYWRYGTTIVTLLGIS